MTRCLSVVVRALLISVILTGVSSLPCQAAEVDDGRVIYEQGRLPSGTSLRGTRFGTERIEGAAAACMACHRRSGMGGVEGEVSIPPITGKALFGSDDRVIATMDPRRGKAFNQPHHAYGEDDLGHALREGTNIEGRTMNLLMPRYQITDDELSALMTYLKTLSTNWSPGVTADRIDFATVIAPGTDPSKKAVLTEMINAVVKTKNSSTRPGKRYMTSAAEMMLKTGRTWNFSVWELHGAPDTWAQQLAQFYKAHPVFALVSGLSGSTWDPVDTFCRKESIPCLFPSVDLVSAQEAQFSPIYYSRGVLLEADVLGAHFHDLSTSPPKRVVQIQTATPASIGAARRLQKRIEGSAILVENRMVGGKVGMSDVLADLQTDDVLVIWASADELHALKTLAPPHVRDIFFSGQLSDGDPQAVPTAWQEVSKLVYPYELPERRRANLGYLKAWLKIRNIPLVSEPLQSEIFFALNFVTDTVSEMLNNLYRDYLMERTENMVAFREGSKAEQELRDRAVLGRGSLRGHNADGASLLEAQELLELGRVEHGHGDQGGTTVYPRLSLGPGQRFASKGAYIVKWTGHTGDGLVPVTDWIVP
jgi:hypothetical protein